MDAYFFASDYCKMYKTGGRKERDVLDHLKKMETKQDGEHELCVFYHEDGEHTATWDIIMSRWAN